MSPVVYLFHGEDEFSIAQAVQGLEARLGDPASAVMNTARLDGRAISLDVLRNAASAIPFIGERRLVIVDSPLAKIDPVPASHEKFLALLDGLPDSTALILVEHKPLVVEKKKGGKVAVIKHWLLLWAESGGERVYVRAYPAPDSNKMAEFIQAQAKAAGGGFTRGAAIQLAGLVGADTRLAYQEVQKLLAHANYQRPVEVEDVQALTAAAGQADIFAMVDALGNQDGKQAMRLLQRLMEEQDYQSLFGMIVRQFRLLLQTREVIDGGGRESDVARLLGVHPFVASKMTSQARHFTLPVLETVYQRLLDIDEAIKTGQIEGEVALDIFVAGTTSRAG